MTIRAMFTLAAVLSAPLLPAVSHAQAPAAAQVPDTAGTGPYPAMKEHAATLPGYVVYRPRDLGKVPARGLGVYLFGNGGCEGDGAVDRQHLLEIASHGYLAIAPGNIYSGPGAAPRPPRPKQNLDAGFQPETPADALDKALDWALAENARQGSTLYGKIDGAQVAASGHSCGGLQALRTGRDPRVKTVVMMNSGLFPDGSSPLGNLSLPKASLAGLRGSIVYILGGPEDIAYANGMDDVRRIGHIPVAAVNLPVGHGGTFNDPDGGKAAAVTVDWLQWRLRGDAAAARQFQGRQCGLCNAPGVQIERKQID